LKAELQALRGEVNNLATNVSTLTSTVGELSETVHALSGQLTTEQIQRRDTDLKLFEAHTAQEARRSIRVELPTGPKWLVVLVASVFTAVGTAVATYFSGGVP
jgi:hypothetical protein